MFSFYILVILLFLPCCSPAWEVFPNLDTREAEPIKTGCVEESRCTLEREPFPTLDS